MELNQCNRCGVFHLSNEPLCQKCLAKDHFEFGIFQAYCEENGKEQPIETISSSTGISEKNLTRFLGDENSENPFTIKF